MASEISFPTAPVDRSTLSKLNTNTFDFKGTCYPLDLFDPNSQYGNNYMVFYINIHEDSQFNKDTLSGAERVAAGLSPSMRDTMGGLSDAAVARAMLVESAYAAKVATDNAVAGVSKAAGDAFGKGNNASTLASNVTTVLSSGLAATGGALLANEIASKKAAYKTSRHAIALYMPQIKTSYNARWESGNTAISQAIGQGLESVNWNESLPNSLNETTFSDVWRLGGAVAEAAAEFGSNVMGAVKGGIAAAALQNTAFASKAAGLAGNPKKEQLFRSIDFRTHSFTYSFSPRSPAEAKAVIEIIKMFKFHMHPEFKPGWNQWLYIYPSEFDIYLYNKGVENRYLPKYASCALTSMNVSYSDGQGDFVTFDDVYMGELINGMPINISMELNFQELALLSKESVDQGF